MSTKRKAKVPQRHLVTILSDRIWMAQYHLQQISVDQVPVVHRIWHQVMMQILSVIANPARSQWCDQPFQSNIKHFIDKRSSQIVSLAKPWTIRKMVIPLSLFEPFNFLSPNPTPVSLLSPIQPLFDPKTFFPLRRINSIHL